jgi:hypothetical protein
MNVGISPRCIDVEGNLFELSRPNSREGIRYQMNIIVKIFQASADIKVDGTEVGVVYQVNAGIFVVAWEDVI